MTEVLPLVWGLAKPSIMERHWLEICDLFKTEIPYNKETFCLRDLLTIKLLDKREDIEDISDSADKQLKLETQLRDDIGKTWESMELEIKPFKNIEAPCYLSGNISEVQEKLEEHLNNLN
jgi:dynein heavy chain, axonemal